MPRLVGSPLDLETTTLITDGYSLDLKSATACGEGGMKARPLLTSLLILARALTEPCGEETSTTSPSSTPIEDASSRLKYIVADSLKYSSLRDPKRLAFSKSWRPSRAKLSSSFMTSLIGGGGHK